MLRQAYIKVIFAVTITLGACAWMPCGLAGEGSSAPKDENFALEELQEPPSTFDVIIHILGGTGPSLPREGRVAVPPLSLGDRLSLSAEHLLRDSGSDSTANWLGKLRGAGQSDSSRKSDAAASGDSPAQKTDAAAASSNWNLSWRSTDSIFSYGKLGSTTLNNVYPLSYGNTSGNRVTINSTGNSLASTYCALYFDKNSYVGFQTWANPSTTFSDARATMWTSTNPTAYTYIYVSAAARTSSDVGKPVTITLTGSASRTLSRLDNKSYNAFTTYVNGSLWASHISYSAGTTNYPFRTVTFNTTVGTSIPIAMESTSYAVKGTSAKQSTIFYVTAR